jgi:hypothetical protein
MAHEERYVGVYFSKTDVFDFALVALVSTPRLGEMHLDLLPLCTALFLLRPGRTTLPLQSFSKGGSHVLVFLGHHGRDPRFGSLSAGVQDPNLTAQSYSFVSGMMSEEYQNMRAALRVEDHVVPDKNGY